MLFLGVRRIQVEVGCNGHDQDGQAARKDNWPQRRVCCFPDLQIGEPDGNAENASRKDCCQWNQNIERSAHADIFPFNPANDPDRRDAHSSYPFRCEPAKPWRSRAIAISSTHAPSTITEQRRTPSDTNPNFS